MDQRITFNFAGSSSQLVSETQKVREELVGIEAAANRPQAAIRELNSSISAFAANNQNSTSEITAEFERLKATILEGQAAGTLSAEQAQERILEIERQATARRVRLAQQTVEALRRANQAGASPQNLQELANAEQNLAQLRQQAARQAIAQNDQQSRGVQRLQGSVADLAAKYFLVVQGLQAVLGAGRATYGALIQQNVQLQEQLLSTQASLASTNEVLVDGVAITDPTEAIQALEGPVNDALARVRRDSLDLVGVTSAELIPIFQNIAGQSGRINASLDESADLTIKFAAALGTTQIPLDQQRQEVSSILQAQITSDSVLARTLGINNEMVRTWQRQGTVVDELNSRLETFAAGNALAAQTIGGVASNIREVFENITLEAGAGLTDQVARELSDFYSLLNANQDDLLVFVQTGADFIGAILNTAREGGAQLLQTLAPIGESLAELFDEDLLNSVELLFQTAITGLDTIAQSVVNNEALQALIQLLNFGVLTAGAIASLNGEFAAGVEAADIYRRQAGAVAQQAVDTLGAIKRGEEGAAAARTEALAAIDDQINILSQANLTGAENRAVVRSQIEELERYRSQLQATGEGVQLVSKSTEQLTAELELLKREFQDSGAEVETAQTQLRAAVQRQLANGAISAREASRQTLEIEREGLDERIALTQEKLAEIQALEAAGGDEEQQRVFRQERLTAERELAQLEIGVAENRISQRQQLEQEALQDLERSQDQATATIRSAATEREIAIQEAINDGTIRQRDAQEQRLDSTRERLAEELALEQENIARLQALSFSDPEDEEENQNRIREARQRTSDLTLNLLENEQRQEEAFIQRTLQNLERSQDQATATIRSATTAREIAIQQAINDGTLRQREAQEQRLDATRERLREELALEQDNLAQLEALTFDDLDQEEANQRRIREARQRTSDLSLQLLENEQNQTEAITERRIQAIADQAAEERNQSEARQQQLREQVSAQEQLNNAYDRQTRLLTAQQDLARAQRSAIAAGGDIEIENLNRAVELRRRLNDESLDPEVRRVIEEQLEALTGGSDTSEAEILAQRVVRENELQQIRRQTQAIEQQAAQANLEVELQRNQLAAERLVIEAQISRLAAEQGVADAQSELDQLQADPNADPQAIRNAQAALDRAQSNASLAERAETNAQANLAQQDQLATLARSRLEAEQQVAIAQFEAADQARVQANELAIAEQNAQGILERLERASDVDFSDTIESLQRRNRNLLRDVEPIIAPPPDLSPAQNFSPGQTQSRSPERSESSQMAQLDQLVNLAQRQVTQAEGLGSQLLRIANRPGTTNNIQNNLVPRDRILTEVGL